MTERGLPIVDGAAACPFVAFDDARDDRADRADPRHRCYAESPPTPRARAHQEAFCLSATFPVCPTFQDWARREAARVLPGGAAGAGSPAERLRDVPAQRTAGERPPAFSAGGGSAPAPTPATPGGFPGAAAASSDADDEARPREPWDLPARRSTQPDWSAPPPWAPPRAATPAGEAEAPGFLRLDLGDDHDDAPDDESQPWSLEAPHGDVNDERDAVEPQANTPSGRQATLARLRALGMGDPAANEAAADDAMGLPRPVPGITRSVDSVTGRAVGTGRPSGGPGATGLGAAGGLGATGGPAAAGGPGLAGGTGTDGGRRPSGGLGRMLGLDRRPRVGATRPAGKAERDPAWERPRRMEAYPTLKTRVGVPMPSRLLLAAAALVVAALVLFFVPPLLLKTGGGPGASPGATRTPAASGSGAIGSASASLAPTPKPTASQQTYKIRSGDTLVKIAKQFGVTVEAILAANKTIKNPDKIVVGAVIVIPAALPSIVIDGGASATP